MCEAVARQEAKGDRYALFGSTTAVIEKIEAGRRARGARHIRDTARSEMEHGRKAFPPGRKDALPPIRPEVNWDPKARLEDMDRAHIDVNVLFPTHVSSYCALRDVGFENALYRAYHRWVVDYCAQAPKRLKWTWSPICATCRPASPNSNTGPSAIRTLSASTSRRRRPAANCSIIPTLPAVRRGAGARFAVLAHGGTARPPYGPGTRDLDGAWFLLHGLSNPWAGMAAMGALIGGGIFDLFPRIRAAIIETAGGWVPAALDRFDTHYLMSPGHVPNLKRMPRDVIAEGRYFHGIDSWERSIEFCVEELGEDMWLFASDWPHGDSAWPEAVPADRRPPASQRKRPAEDPRRERDAPMPAAAGLTRSAYPHGRARPGLPPKPPIPPLISHCQSSQSVDASLRLRSQNASLILPFPLPNPSLGKTRFPSPSNSLHE